VINKIILGIILVIAVLGGAIWLMSTISQADRDRAAADLVIAEGQARAIVIQAQGQSRLDSAQAFTVTTSAVIPFIAMLAIVGIIAGVMLAIVNRQAAPAAPVHIIERQTVMVLQPGQSRRELWQMLALSQKRIDRLN